ncbi:SIR2 family protein [Planomicrobium sp. Y74]|uniref:SIR2 family NAD-dependent protein deacylase n=1 Tax=Planomicrobium sp. Y74 TaxID=2478977 RepID=UPI000EF47B02|nr:SIR2 family protein [Planomicrobium sp. Y74]RLQ91951.1 SIR2 family protein [Planomicrobium sp. Y74]
MTNYLNEIPRPLLEDIINNQCIPIIGAGFSKNCELPLGQTMPLWEDLGKEIAKDLQDHPDSNALDAISSYAFEYSRAKLVEKLSRLLHVSEAKPGNAHKSFCNIPFDKVCTTNFDFLLEKGYDSLGKYCLPIIDEEQLAINSHRHLGQSKNVHLLKLHGDLHHPDRMIVTEEDYDSFLEKYPLMATYLANLLITRTPLFIGYSLEDADFRQVWQIISSRLGNLRRPAYVITIDAKQAAINRFKRRGVNVINFNDVSYQDLFVKLFEEIREYWVENIQKNIISYDELTLTELSLPKLAANRLCYISVPQNKISFYKSYVYPLIEQCGFLPISAEELVTPGQNINALEASLLEKADLVIFDLEDNKFQNAIGNILSNRDKAVRILFLSNRNAVTWKTTMNEKHKIMFLYKENYSEEQNSEAFLEEVKQWLDENLSASNLTLQDQPKKLLEANEYKAAVLSSISLLEYELNNLLNNQGSDKDFKTSYSRGHIPLSKLIDVLYQRKIIENKMVNDLKNWLTIRNRVAHNISESVTNIQAEEIVNGINTIIDKIKMSEI